jgi:hypothetical protein
VADTGTGGRHRCDAASLVNGVKAQWNLTEVADEDPFGAVMYSTGLKLDLNASEEELAEQVVRLLRREGALGRRGLRCALKDNGQDCRCCREATLDPAERRSVLCRLGKDQETVEERFNQRRAARLAAVEELVCEIDAATEVLPADLEELITQVGG